MINRKRLKQGKEAMMVRWSNVKREIDVQKLVMFLRSISLKSQQLCRLFAEDQKQLSFRMFLLLADH